MSLCSNEGCVKGTDPSKLLLCTRCRSARYCNKACQRRDWRRRHKEACQVSPAHSSSTPDRLESVFSNLHRKKIFNFHEEYKTEYPMDQSHFQFLSVYHEAACNGLKSEHADPLRFLVMVQQNSELYNRWGKKFMNPRFNSFLVSDPAVGEIAPWVNDGYIAGDHKYFNTMNDHSVNEMIVKRGDTMVMIGLQNLHQLIMTNLKEEGETQKPFKLIAINMSPVYIAKSIVVHSMMMENCRSKSILQVMFSTIWDEPTLLEFCMCCAKMALKYRNIPKIHLLLRVWLEIKITVSSGVELWQSHQGVKFQGSYVHKQMLFLKNKVDRVDYARYLSTGSVFVSEKDGEVGNITTADLHGPYCVSRGQNENIYNTIAPEDILEEGVPILKSLQKKLIHQVDVLKQNLIQGRIECEFHCEEVSLKNESILSYLKKQSVNTVDWANCLSYLNPDEAHKICCAISSKEAKIKHIGFFKDLSKYVYGATSNDYPSQNVLLPLLEDHQCEYASFSQVHQRFLPPAEAPLLLDTPRSIERQLSKKFFKKFALAYFEDNKFKISDVKYCDFNIFGVPNNSLTVHFELVRVHESN